MTKKTFRTWSTGEIVTAAQLNEQIRDNGNAIWVGTTNGDIEYYTASDSKSRLAIGTAGQSLKVVAGVPAWASAYGCKAYHIAAQATNDNTLTDISTFDGESFDYGGYHAGTDNFLTVPTGLEGLYIITANGYFAAHATGDKLREICVKINTTYIERSSTVNPYSDTVNDTWLSICVVKNLVANDTVRFAVRQCSGAALNFSYATLTLAKIG